MSDRESMISYIEAKAQRIRAKADSGEQGWALGRHDSTVLMTVASDLRAMLDAETEVAA